MLICRGVLLTWSSPRITSVMRHVDVVDDDGEVVGRKSVRAEDHEIVEFVVAPLDATLDLVVEHDAAAVRIPEADHAIRIVAQRFVALSR